MPPYIFFILEFLFLNIFIWLRVSSLEISYCRYVYQLAIISDNVAITSPQEGYALWFPSYTCNKNIQFRLSSFVGTLWWYLHILHSLSVSSSYSLVSTRAPYCCLFVLPFLLSLPSSSSHHMAYLPLHYWELLILEIGKISKKVLLLTQVNVPVLVF